MRERSAPLPSPEEAVEETKRRLGIIKALGPRLKEFSEAVIVAGSVGYGKNYSVRKESDIDLIILINRVDIDSALRSGLFEITPQVEEGRDFFARGEVDHFSVIEKINDVEVQFHFWDKESHFKAGIEDYLPKVYDVFSRESYSLSGYDFSGNKREIPIGNVKKCKYGVIHDFPSSFIFEDHFVPRQIILNLISDPDILFSKDDKLLENIEKIWNNLVVRLMNESGNEINFEKRNIMNSIYGWWNMSPESKRRVENKIRKALSKHGVNVD